MADVREELTIVARLRDQASPGIKKVTKNVEGFRKKASRAFDRVKRAAGGAAGGIGKVVSASRTAALVVAGISAALTAAAFSMSTAAADAEELSSKFDALFGDSSAAAREWAEDYRKTVARGRQDTLSALADMRGFTEGLGLASGEADDLAMRITELGVDLSSFYNVSQDEAMQRLRSGLIGNTEALDAFAARISESQLKEYAEEQGIVYKALTDTEKVLLRLELLQRKVNKAVGDAARTSGSFQNQMRALSGAVTDARVEFGAFVNEDIQGAIERVGGPEGLNDLLRVAGAVTAEFAEAVLDAAAFLGGDLVQAIDAVGGVEAAILRISTAWERVKLSAAEATLDIRAAIRAAAEIGTLGFANTEADARADAMLRANIAQQRRMLAEAEERYLSALRQRVQAEQEGIAPAQALAEVAEKKAGAGERDAAAAFQAASALGLQLAQIQQIAALTAQVGMSALFSGDSAQTPAAPAPSQPASSVPVFAQAAVSGAQAAAAAVNEYQKQIEKAEDGTKRAFAGQFVSFFSTIASGARTAEDAVRSLVQSLAGLVAQGIARQAILPAFGLSAFANGGIVSGGGFYGGGAMPVKGYANGGPIFRGPHIGIIGEGSAPAEAAIPLPDGKNVPVKLMGGGGGGQTNVSLNVQALDARSVADLFAQNGEALANVIARQFSRDRNFKSALTGGA